MESGLIYMKWIGYQAQIEELSESKLPNKPLAFRMLGTFGLKRC